MRFRSRETVEDCRAVDIRRWNRECKLIPGFSFGWQWTRNGDPVASIDVHIGEVYILISYRLRIQGAQEWENVDQRIPLEKTPSAFGGSRTWFRCPLPGCERRVALLYLGRKYFGCRHCHHLPHKSTLESPLDRVTRRADKIRARLGWEPGILNGNGEKPKWMRWSTFRRFTWRHDYMVHLAFRAMAQKFGGMGLG